MTVGAVAAAVFGQHILAFALVALAFLWAERTVPHPDGAEGAPAVAEKKARAAAEENSALPMWAQGPTAGEAAATEAATSTAERTD